jgi:hypothetical protein
MHPQLILVEQNNLHVCSFRLKETLGLAYHYLITQLDPQARCQGSTVVYSY